MSLQGIVTAPIAQGSTVAPTRGSTWLMQVPNVPTSKSCATSTMGLMEVCWPPYGGGIVQNEVKSNTREGEGNSTHASSLSTRAIER